MRDQTLDGSGGRARAGLKFKTGFNRFLSLKSFGTVLMAFMSCSTQLTKGQDTEALDEVVKEQHYTWDVCGKLLEKVRRRLFSPDSARGIVWIEF